MKLFVLTAVAVATLLAVHVGQHTTAAFGAAVCVDDDDDLKVHLRNTAATCAWFKRTSKCSTMPNEAIDYCQKTCNKCGKTHPKATTAPTKGTTYTPTADVGDSHDAGGSTDGGEPCVDDDTFKDSYGDCNQYEDSGWCQDAKQGPKWLASWGKLSTKAIASCCACGKPALPVTKGGKGAGPSHTGGNTGATGNRDGGASHDGSSDAGGSTDGGAATGGAGPQSCVGGKEDRPSGYTDKQGHDCKAYLSKRLCTTNGEVGAGWNATWGDLTPEANDECCACGGGETPGADGDDSPEIDMMAVTPGCVDLPGTDGKAWTDTKGHACSKYEESLWCLPDGEDGDNWKTHGMFAPELPQEALNHCCYCGGGSKPKPGCPLKCPSRQ